MSEKPTGLLAWKIANKLVPAYRAFSLKLFQQVVQQDSQANIFLSPFSVAILLQMLYTGAAGGTRQALAQALELAELDLETIHRGNAEFRKNLSDPGPGVELLLANSLWVRAGLEFKTDYLEHVRDSFAAEIRGLDFADPAAADAINRWAAKNTKEKITGIIDRLDPLMAMVLSNALYFKAQWQEKFDPGKTKEKPFFRADGSQTKVPMMAQEGNYPYYEDSHFQAVGLAYGAGRFSLYIFVPKTKSLSPLSILRSEQFEKVSQVRLSFPSRDGTVELPRFKFEYERNLGDVLKALGAGEIFSDRAADFAGIRAERDLFVSQVLQKAVVEVNEEGTEAAAVTDLLMAGAPGPPPLPFKLVADRPFFFFIQDNQTRLVLFMGVMNDPG